MVMCWRPTSRRNHTPDGLHRAASITNCVSGHVMYQAPELCPAPAALPGVRRIEYPVSSVESAEDTNSEDGLAAGFDSQRGTRQQRDEKGAPEC